MKAIAKTRALDRDSTPRSFVCMTREEVARDDDLLSYLTREKVARDDDLLSYA